MNLILRKAELNDTPFLQLWDQKEHVKKSTGEDDNYDWENEIPREVDWQEILIAEAGPRPIGVVIIIDPAREETHYWGAIGPGLRAIDIWIGEETDLNRGYGTQMMRQGLERCFRDPQVKAVIIDPLVNNTKAIRFYERLGFRRIDRRKFGSDDCYVYRLERTGWTQ